MEPITLKTVSAETVYDVLTRAQQLAAAHSHGAVADAHLTLALARVEIKGRSK